MPETILLIDDDINDAEMLEKCLRQIGVANPIQRVTSVNEAILYLNGEANFSDRVSFPFPKIIFLDLRMPGADGFDFLEWVSVNGLIENFKIFVITALEDLSLIRCAYEKGATSFVQKPCSVRELQNLVSSFPLFWVQPPPAGPADGFQNAIGV